MMNYEQRLAQAKIMMARPVKADMPGQKFPRGARVRIAAGAFSYYKEGFNGIIDCTYAQKYWGDDIKSYSVIVLNDLGGSINAVAWINETSMTLISDNIKTGLAIIGAYKAHWKSI